MGGCELKCDDESFGCDVKAYGELLLLCIVLYGAFLEEGRPSVDAADAGLDLLWKENPELEGHPLLGRSNVIITPHAGFYSETSLTDMIRIACENLIYSLRGEHHLIDDYVIHP